LNASPKTVEEYRAFLEGKFKFSRSFGHEVAEERVNPMLFPHQRDIVRWAVGEALEERHALPASFMAIAPGSHHPAVWTDVNRMRTLNGNQSQKGLVNHVCPLQFDIVDRIIGRFTNKGETVFDPFAGLMTVPYRAIKLGRFGRGVELNREYFADGLRYLRLAEIEAGSPTLFDFEEADVSLPEEIAA
jgi:hypothetical protein